jgi:molybdenum cofactor cytidylyltransferase
MGARADLSCIVLAAGRSTRMGPANKLLAEVGGKPMVRVVVETALASTARPVLVVTGHQAAEVRAALAGLDVTFCTNPDYALGLSTSLKAGIRAVPASCAGALVLLGDMPRITPEMIDRMIDIFAAAPEGSIIMAAHGGVRGNPVLWPRRHFEALTLISGDTGARGLIGDHARDVIAVELGEAAAFDLDTPEALSAAGGTLPGN